MKKLFLLLSLIFYSAVGYILAGIIAIIVFTNSCQSDGTAEQKQRQKIYLDSIDRVDSIAWQKKIDSIDRK